MMEDQSKIGKISANELLKVIRFSYTALEGFGTLTNLIAGILIGSLNRDDLAKFKTAVRTNEFLIIFRLNKLLPSSFNSTS